MPGKTISATTRTQAALGFRAHSGWAALVAVAGLPGSPSVIDRRRIELADPDIPRPVQPYHAAEGLDLKQAERIIGGAAGAARRLARQSLRSVVEHLGKAGHKVVGCGILLGSGRTATTLAQTLCSHALIHTAEGELFRGAIARASGHLHLPVTGVKEREIFARGAAELRLSVEELERRLNEVGGPLGPPWTRDQKLAVLVAWLALTAHSRR